MGSTSLANSGDDGHKASVLSSAPHSSATVIATSIEGVDGGKHERVRDNGDELAESQHPHDVPKFAAVKLAAAEVGFELSLLTRSTEHMWAKVH